MWPGQAIERARWVLGMLCASVGAVCLTSCSTQTGQPSINVTALHGSWAGEEGVLTFSADHTFMGRNLQLSPSSSLGCDNLSGTGTWQFLSSKGVSAPSLIAIRQGDLIGVDLNGLSGCNFQLTTWRPNNVITLCLFSDPDSPCSTPVFKRVNTQNK